VEPADLKVMTELIPAPTQTHGLAGLSHLLRDDPTKAGLSGYKRQAKKPVDARVISLVSQWLAVHSR